MDDPGLPAEAACVLSRFESLGGRLQGCEFGPVQRAAGLEPPGLLRWTELYCEELLGTATSTGLEHPGRQEAVPVREHQANRRHLQRGEGKAIGGIVAQTGSSLTIRGQGGVHRPRCDGGKKIPAAEAGLPIGAVLGG